MGYIPFEKRLEMRKRPEQIPLMYQEWRDLLFLHWEYDAHELQKTLPPGLIIDTFEGKSYVSIAPFFIKNFKVFNIPILFSKAIEINVRTYVYDEHGVPGIWFYSLDISSLMLATFARALFFLPYHYASLHSAKKESILIEGHRSGAKKEMIFQYEPKGIGTELYNDSLDFFLIERYVLFSFSSNKLYKQKIHHLPYKIQRVDVKKCENNLFKLDRLPQPTTSPIVHYSSGVDVDLFALKKSE